MQQSNGRATGRTRPEEKGGRSMSPLACCGAAHCLAVSDRDHVGRNVRRHVAGLGLDDGQSGHGAAEHLLWPHKMRSCEQSKFQLTGSEMQKLGTPGSAPWTSSRRARGDESGGRRRRQGKPHAQEDDGAEATSAPTQKHVVIQPQTPAPRPPSLASTLDPLAARRPGGVRAA